MTVRNPSCTLNPDCQSFQQIRRGGEGLGSESPGQKWSGDTRKGQETKARLSKAGEAEGALVSRPASVPGSADTSCGNFGNSLNLSGSPHPYPKNEEVRHCYRLKCIRLKVTS